MLRFSNPFFALEKTFLNTEISTGLFVFIVCSTYRLIQNDGKTLCRRTWSLTDFLSVARKWSMRVMDDWSVWLGLIAHRQLDLWITIDSSHMATCWTRNAFFLTVASKLWFKLCINQTLSTKTLFVPFLCQLMSNISEKIVYITANSPALAECHISHLKLLQGRQFYTLLTIESLCELQKVFTTHPETWGEVGPETIITFSVHHLHIYDTKTNLIKCIYRWKDLNAGGEM